MNDVKNYLSLVDSLRAIAFFSVTAIVGRFFSLLTILLLLKSLNLRDFGIIEYSITISFLLVNLCMFGQDSAITRFFYEFRTRDRRKQLISQSFCFQLLCAAILLPIFYALTLSLTSFRSEVIEPKWLLLIIFLRVPLLLIIEFSLNVIKCTQEKTRFTLLAVGFPLIQLSVLSFVLSGPSISILEILVTLIMVDIIFSLIALAFIFHWFAFPKGFALIRRLIPFALPLGISAILVSFSPVLERTLIISYAGAHSMSEYAVATKFAIVVIVLSSAFHNTWGPLSLQIRGQPDAIRIYNNLLHLFVLFVCLISLVLVFAAPLLLDGFDLESNHTIKTLVFPLVLAAAIHGTSSLIALGVSISKRSDLLLLSYIVGIITTGFSIWVLVPLVGVWGAGFSVLLGSLTNAFTVFYFAQKVNFIDWDLMLVFSVFIFTALLGFSFEPLLVHTSTGLAYGFLSFGMIVLFITGARCIAMKSKA